MWDSVKSMKCYLQEESNLSPFSSNLTRKRSLCCAWEQWYILMNEGLLVYSKKNLTILHPISCDCLSN